MTFGFGGETGIDLPGEASGRIADRRWKLQYWKQMKGYYCGIAAKPQDAKTSDFVYLFAEEFCVEGYAYRAGDAVNFAIGQGDTIVTPLQLARAYGAHRQRRHPLRAADREGDRQPRRHGAQAVRARRRSARSTSRLGARLHRHRAEGRDAARHHELAADRLPARAGPDPVQDRLGRGLRQAVDLLGGLLHRRLRGGDDGQPGRHRLRAPPARDARDLRGALRHRGDGRRPRPGRHPRRRGARLAADRSSATASILPPACGGRK